MSSQENDSMMLALMEMREQFDPIVDVAEGFKATLIERGWATHVAEAAAGEMLLGMIRHVYLVIGIEANKLAKS